MQPIEAVVKMAKMANADGIKVIVQPGVMSGYAWDTLYVAQHLPLLSQMICMSHEMGHHFDFKADPMNHTELAFRTDPRLRGLLHTHSMTLYREKRAWVIGEEILQGMRLLSVPRSYRIFARIKQACLDTYFASAEGASQEEIIFRADTALYVLTHPEDV